MAMLADVNSHLDALVVALADLAAAVNARKDKSAASSEDLDLVDSKVAASQVAVDAMKASLG